VTVPEDLMELIHMLAENNHKVWAKERIKAGWKYGSATVCHYVRMKHNFPREKIKFIVFFYL